MDVPPVEGGQRKPTRSFVTLLRAFLGLLGPGRPALVGALATLTVATALALAMPASTKLAIDYVLTDNPGPEGLPLWLPRDRELLLWLLAGGLLTAALLSAAVGIWGRWQMTLLTKRTQALLRRRAFDHAVRLPLHRVHALKSGGVASLLREDAGGAGDLVFSMLYNPWRAIVQLVGTLVILAVVDWRLLLGSLLLLPMIWLTHQTWIRRIRPVFRDIRQTRQNIDAHAAEVFGGMRVVRAFGREKGEARVFTTGGHYMIRQELLAWWWSRAVDIAWEIIIPLASAAVLVYGGLMVLRGSLTIGDVMMFSAYVLMLLGPLETLAATATSVQTNLAGLDKLLDLFAEPREFQASDPAHAATAGALLVLRPDAVAGRITLRDVSFRYPAAAPDAPPVLQGVTLDVAPGEAVALVGPSGSGKTTLCNLVARFYDPTHGAVLLDGVDLRRIDPASHRALLGVVEQDVFLFDGTVAENIGYARPDAPRDAVVAAARAAHAHEFIQRLERGYETVIGERGVRLSGGQKQRLAIARAILADPRVLILDEATSNLDSESEALIQRSLGALMRGRTSFVIAHRLSTVRRCDRIVVIEDGRLTQAGTHEELLAAGGRYADLLRMQLEGAEGPGPRRGEPSPVPAHP